VQYTVRSKGRAIGVTDFGFVCHDVHHRMGWFHPNALGERLMTHVSALHVALRASNGKYDESIFRLDPEILGAEEPYMEALRRVDALELTLHREDGTRVQTESISISDTEMLIALCKDDEEMFDEEDWQSYEWLDDPDDPFELSADLDGMLASPTLEPIEAWQPEDDADENVEFPRFQIQVRVATPLGDSPVIADEDWWRKHGDRW
jgi:hypothetical protein